MPFNPVLMLHKENCKVEGEVITRFKIARLYFFYKKTQREIAANVQCHYNTINNIVRKCKKFASKEAMHCLRTKKKIHSEELDLFDFLKSDSRRPKSNKRCAVFTGSRSVQDPLDYDQKLVRNSFIRFLASL